MAEPVVIGWTADDGREGWFANIDGKLVPVWGPAIQAEDNAIRDALSKGRNIDIWPVVSERGWRVVRTRLVHVERVRFHGLLVMKA